MAKFTLSQLAQMKADQSQMLNTEKATAILNSADNIMRGRLPENNLPETLISTDPTNLEQRVEKRPEVTRDSDLSSFIIGGPNSEVGDNQNVGLDEVRLAKQEGAGDITLTPEIDPYAAPVVNLATAAESRSLLKSTVEKGSLDRSLFQSNILNMLPEAAKIAQEYNANNLKYNESEIDYIENLITTARKSTTGVDNIFDSDAIAILPEDKAAAKDNAQLYLKNKADDINYILKSEDKLNLSIDSSNITASLQETTGPIMAIGVLTSIIQILQKQAAEEDKEDNNKRYQNALSVQSLGPMVSRAIEYLRYPSLGDDGSPIIGLPDGYGYKSRLTNEEHSIFGQYVLDAFANSPLFDFITPSEFKDATGKTVKTYASTRIQNLNLNKVISILSDQLNLGLNKPVRHSRKPVGFRGPQSEGTGRTQRTTKSILYKSPTEEMNKAVFKLDNVAHSAIATSTVLLAGFLKKGLTDGGAEKLGLALPGGVNRERSAAAIYTKQGKEYYDKKVKTYEEEYKIKEEKEGLKPSDLDMFDPNTREPVVTFRRAAQLRAETVQKRHAERWERRLTEGFSNMNLPIYFDNMQMANLYRIFAMQNEMNYTQDKVARGILGPAVATLFKRSPNPKSIIDNAIREIKSGKMESELSEEKRYLAMMARTLVPDADTYIYNSYANLLSLFKDNYDTYVKYGNILLPYLDSQKPNIMPDKIGYTAENPSIITALPDSSDLNNYLLSMGKNEFYFSLSNLADIAKYNAAAEGSQFQTSIKAESDGVANGATILGAQLGLYEIIVRGGLIYSGDPSVEETIREYVFDKMASMLPEVYSEKSDVGDWHKVFQSIRADYKAKELTKSPIMTSMYGLEADFQIGAAEAFFKDNPKYFDHMDEQDPRKIVEGLRNYLSDGLKLGLGGALDHAKLAKRIGRLFVWANKPAFLTGPELGDGPLTAPQIAATGIKSVMTSSQLFPRGPGLLKEGEDQSLIQIDTYKAESAPGAQKTRKMLSSGSLTKGYKGDKLMDSLAVGSTILQDAATVIKFTNEILEDGDFFMQVYDGAMGDVKSFFKITEGLNKTFLDILKNYHLLLAERDMMINLIKEIKKEAADSPTGTKDLSPGGEYEEFGSFIRNGAARDKIIERELPGNPNDSRIASKVNVGSSVEDTDHTRRMKIKSLVKKEALEFAKVILSNKKFRDTGIMTNAEYADAFIGMTKIVRIQNDMEEIIRKAIPEKDRLLAKVDITRQFK